MGAYATLCGPEGHHQQARNSSLVGSLTPLVNIPQDSVKLQSLHIT